MTPEFDLLDYFLVRDGSAHPPGAPLVRMSAEQANGFLGYVLRQAQENAPAEEREPFDGYAVILPDGTPALLQKYELSPRRPALRVVR